MANLKTTKGAKEIGRKSMKTTKGGGVKIPDFNPQPEPPGFNPQPEPPGMRKGGGDPE